MNDYEAFACSFARANAFYTHNALAVDGGVLMWHGTLALLLSTHLGSFSKDEILSWRLAVRHPGSLPHCLCSSWIADMVTVYGTLDHCQNYQIEFSRGKFRKVVSAIEDDFNFDSRAAWISVISKCTSTYFGCKCLHFLSLRCITIWKVKVIIWVNFLISFIAAVRTVVVQLIIFLFYWSGAKNNLPPGILNLFHRSESMRTLRNCILKLDNERLRSVCLFLCACKHVV